MIIGGETDGDVRILADIRRPQFKLVAGALQGVRHQGGAGAVLQTSRVVEAEASFEVSAARVDGR